MPAGLSDLIWSCLRYRGNKGTVWEGGTLAAAFVHSPNPDLIPESRCGTESFTLAQ